jgi:small-conductance mechanosensitive channel
LKAKLASEGINSYLKNEYVNNVVVMPINQDYFLLVSDEDFEKAKEIINNQQDIIEE